jgi:hypothetical protein
MKYLPFIFKSLYEMVRLTTKGTEVSTEDTKAISVNNPSLPQHKPNTPLPQEGI